jgi:hypothetical protein
MCWWALGVHWVLGIGKHGSTVSYMVDSRVWILISCMALFHFYQMFFLDIECNNDT